MTRLQKLRMKYALIVIWHKDTGSYGYYIDQQLEKAERMAAPYNAIYERNGKWHTLDEINIENREWLPEDMLRRSLEYVHRIAEGLEHD